MLSLVTTLAALAGVHARRSVALFCVWVTLLMANLASAEVGVQAKTRVWDFEQSAPQNVSPVSAASAQQHREIRSSGGEVAADSLLAARGGPGSGLLNQSREQLVKSQASLEGRIAEHQQKLADYIADPLAHDNKGILRNAPTEAIRDKIVAGRVRELESQIAKRQGELQKVLGRLKEGAE